LFCFFLSVCSSTGGKSPLRLIDAHLQGRLEGLAPKFAHHLQHRNFAAVDPVPIGGRIDRIGDPTHRLLELDLHTPNELLDGKLNLLPFHGHAPWGRSLATIQTIPAPDNILPDF
jgi:hypothetical protein